jgi:hypothetical protein
VKHHLQSPELKKEEEYYYFIYVPTQGQRKAEMIKVELGEPVPTIEILNSRFVRFYVFLERYDSLLIRYSHFPLYLYCITGECFAVRE